MAATDASHVEREWLAKVGEILGGVEPPSAADVRSLLRVTKVTADATTIRYLAPLTAYLIGRASAGEGFEMRAAVDAISRLAEGWGPAPAG